MLECLPSHLLADLMRGNVVEPELSDLSLHLEACAACQQRAKTLPPDDTLTAPLRGEDAVHDKIAKDVPWVLLERLKEIPQRESRAEGSDLASAELTLDFLAPAQRADEIGRLGHYRILKVLGTGGMGAVFLADDTKLERQVALKVMLPGSAANRAARERFLREARAAAKLKCDHIVTIYEVDEANGVPYLTMELLAGQSLEDRIRFGPALVTAEVVHLARDIALGLAGAHESGLVHRDIKPGNLWLETTHSGFRVKILDFGLAHVDKDNARITRSGAILGTPAYMAPEQAHGARAVDARVDLFSLGCVLYELCSGDVPFKAETTVGVLVAIATNDPVPLAHNPSIPKAISELIMQLLEKDPRRRPPSAREVIARLAEIERSLTGNNLAAPNRPPRRRLLLACAATLMVAVSVLAATVVFWPAPEGRVVRIECDDPSIKIAFADGELKVTGAYKEPITLKPGKVDLKITRKSEEGDDFEFETDKLIVNKGDKIVLKIEVVEGKVQIVQSGKGVLDSKLLPVKPPVTDPDRRAAEWTLRLGGMLWIDRSGTKDIKDISDVPKDGFTVTNVMVFYNPAVTDASLENLEGLKGLKFLNLGGTSVTDDGLSRLKEHKGLTRLVLERLKLTKKGLAHLKEFKDLEVLHLGEVPVTDDGLAELLELRGLTTLCLSYAEISAEGLGRLKQFKDLSSLNLRGTAATDETIEQLKDLKLGSLDLSETKLTDKGLARLKQFKELRTLWLEKTGVTKERLADLHAVLPRCTIYHDGATIAPK